MGATMGSGPGSPTIYDPSKKNKGDYWKAVQADLNKYSKTKIKPKTKA